MSVQAVIAHPVVVGPSLPLHQAIEMAVAGERNARQGDLSGVVSAILGNVNTDDWAGAVAGALIYALDVQEHPDPQGFYRALVAQLAPSA